MAHRILCNVMYADGWSVHFIDEDGRTRVGPWLILDTRAQVEALLHSGHITEEEFTDYQADLRHWARSSVHLHLDEEQYARLVAEGKRRPWDGYEEMQRRKRRKE